MTMTPLENLVSRNFLAICDVVMDMREGLQMTKQNEVEISLLRTIIRGTPFNQLMPADSLQLRAEYCKLRLRALEYLKEEGCVISYSEPLDFPYYFDTIISIEVNRQKFEEFNKNLSEVFEKRVVEPNKEIFNKNNPYSNFSNLTQENLERIQKCLKILLDELEMVGFNRLTEIAKIPLGRFRKEGFEQEDIIGILKRVDDSQKIIKTIDVNGYKNTIDKNTFNFITPLKVGNTLISKEDIENKLILEIKDLNKLKQIGEDITKELSKRRDAPEKQNELILSQYINEIICVKPNSGSRFKIVLNSSYNKTLVGDKTKDDSSWDILFKVANNEYPPFNEKGKQAIDYFNSNSNCKLYTQTEYKLTKILKVEGRAIVSNIKMKVIGEKAFKQRQEKNKT